MEIKGQSRGLDLGQILISAEVVEQLILAVVREHEAEAEVEGGNGLILIPRGIELARGDEDEEGGLKVRLQFLARYGTRVPEAARRLMLRLHRRLYELAELEIIELELEIKGLSLQAPRARAHLRSGPSRGR